MEDTPTTNSGASNASDFQPLTQNPQSASPNLQPTGQGLQPVPGDEGSERLDQLPATPLTVETVKASPDSEVSQITRPGIADSFAGWLPFLAALIIAIWLFRRWNLFSPRTTVLEEPDEPVKTENTIAPKKAAAKPVKSKPKSRKKSKARK